MAATLAVRHLRLRPIPYAGQCTKFTHHRRYHYHAASSPPISPFDSMESAILSAGLLQVPQHGFTRTALELGAQEAGYLPASAAMCPHGPFDLVRFHLVTRRLALDHEVQFPERNKEDKMGIGERVRALTLARLRGNESLIHYWQESSLLTNKALALSARPSYAQIMLSELFQLSDELWHLAGDRSVDFSWYTRRASLAAIYASAEIFQTTDTSTRFRDTEAFVDRRLEEANEVGGALAAVGEWAAFSARGAVNVARSKGLRI